MSFPAYDEYKDSGVDWLGKVPSDWTVTSLKRVSSICYGIGEPPKYQEEGTRLVRATNVSRGSISDVGMVYVDPTHIPEQRIVWLAEGDIIVVRSGAYTGDSAIIPDGYGEAIAGFDMVMRLHGAFPKFVQYALLGNYVKDFQLELKRMRAAQPHLNAEELGECVFVAPDLDEQKAISSFLDVETSKIDGLVSEQRRLIELLKEKCQAVISHAVTKGLNPNAPMKPSGIQWLGDVPEHWVLHNLRRLVAKFVDYRGRTPTKTDSGVPLITAGAIRDGMIDHSRCPEYIAESDYDDLMSRGLPEVGDVVITTEAPLGEVAQVNDQNVAFAQRVILFKGNKERMLPDFMRYWYLSINGKDELYSRASGSTASGIRADRLKRSIVPTPPVDEQRQIVNYLGPVLERLLAPIADAERAIGLLQERRTALISAAVTGKIDVRKFTHQETT